MEYLADWHPFSRVGKYMMTSSNGSIFRFTGPFCAEFASHRWIPLTKANVMRSFDVFFDLRLNKRLSKHSGRRWFKTVSRSLWRHCNEMSQIFLIYSEYGKIFLLNVAVFTTGKVMEYLKTTMETLVYDLLEMACHQPQTSNAALMQLTCSVMGVICKSRYTIHCTGIHLFDTSRKITHNFQSIYHYILNLWNFFVHSIIRWWASHKTYGSVSFQLWEKRSLCILNLVV